MAAPRVSGGPEAGRNEAVDLFAHSAAMGRASMSGRRAGRIVGTSWCSMAGRPSVESAAR
ncbi:hypothetical protein [Streptomyces cuspidosporus]|uniref:hypothetical protein n=1 Tax=Streptomyces cuspidosporus TaxID=66882 RepID=UPI0031FBE329